MPKKSKGAVLRLGKSVGKTTRIVIQTKDQDKYAVGDIFKISGSSNLQTYNWIGIVANEREAKDRASSRQFWVFEFDVVLTSAQRLTEGTDGSLVDRLATEDDLIVVNVTIGNDPEVETNSAILLP